MLRSPVIRIEYGRVPQVPSNFERLQAFRAARTPEIGNSHPWAWRDRAYAAEQTPLSRDEMQLGFDFKYGQET